MVAPNTGVGTGALPLLSTGALPLLSRKFHNHTTNLLNFVFNGDITIINQAKMLDLLLIMEESALCQTTQGCIFYSSAFMV